MTTGLFEVRVGHFGCCETKYQRPELTGFYGCRPQRQCIWLRRTIFWRSEKGTSVLLTRCRVASFVFRYYNGTQAYSESLKDIRGLHVVVRMYTRRSSSWNLRVATTLHCSLLMWRAFWYEIYYVDFKLKHCECALCWTFLMIVGIFWFVYQRLSAREKDYWACLRTLVHVDTRRANTFRVKREYIEKQCLVIHARCRGLRIHLWETWDKYLGVIVYQQCCILTWKSNATY